MTPAEFVGWIKKNAARVTEYQNGGDGTGGKCDCIGLIIGAWRLSGNKWPWTHGSNYTARYLTRDLQKNASLQLGDLVFKARAPGAAGYSLPDRYKGGSDLLDYYHVGVVTQLHPLQITHCTGVKGGIKIDTARGQWLYSGMFSKLSETAGADAQQGEEKTVSEIIATVHSENGQPVNVRSSAGTNYPIVCKVPNDTEVTVLGNTSTGWTRVQYGRYTGYMMSQFLSSGDPDAAQTAQLSQVKALLQQALALLNEMEG